MASKKCSYKNCSSVQTPDIPCKETFFKFPKDERRYQLWMTLGRCENRNVRGPKYLCSKHFDHLKYMSTNPRRKLLLNNAIPFEYQSDDNDGEGSEAGAQDVVSTQFEDEEFFAIGDSIEGDNSSEHASDNHDIVIQFGESSNSTQVEIVEPSEFDKDFDQHLKSSGTFKIDKSTPGNSCQKRKLRESEDSGKTYQVIKMKPKVSPTYGKLKQTADLNVEKASINDKEKDNYKMVLPEEEEENLVTNPNVSTFIFKNEEYLQMPKRFYVFEKMELLREIEYYKGIVTNCKNLLENVKL